VTFKKAIAAIALRVRGVDAVIGYELFNEPSPGEATAAGFEERYLTEFYECVGSAVREADSSAPVWVEPEGLTNAGNPATLGEIDISQLVYSFHNYADLPLNFANLYAMDRTDAVGYRNQEWVVTNNRQRAEALNAVPVMAEFSPGNDTEDSQNLSRLADKYRISWTY